MSGSGPVDRGRRERDVWLHLAALATVGVSFYGLFLVAFNLYLVRLGYGTAFIGGLTAAGMLLFVVFSVPASAVGRRIGSRRSILIGTSLYAIGFSVIPFTDQVAPDARTAVLVSGYLVAYLGGPFFWVNSTMYLMAIVPPERRMRVFALRTALAPFAGVIGSLIAGAVPQAVATITGTGLDEPAPYRASLVLAGLAYVIAVGATLASREAPRVADPRVTRAVGAKPARAPWPLIVPLVVIEVLRRAGETGAMGFSNLYFDDRLGAAPVTIGAVAALALLGSGCAALATPLLARRFGVQSTTTLAMVGTASGLGLLALPVPATAYLGYVVTLACGAVSMTALMTYRMEVVSSTFWPLMSGAMVTAQGLGESAVMAGGGVLIASSGFAAYYLLLALLTASSAGMFWTRFRNLTAHPG